MDTVYISIVIGVPSHLYRFNKLKVKYNIYIDKMISLHNTVIT
jgi:hypothetical protein